VRCFETAVRLNPREAQGWRGLGKAHLAQGRNQRAIEALDRAVQLQPSFVNARYELGIAQGRTGDWVEAFRSVETAVQLQEQGEEQLKQMQGRIRTQEGVALSVLFRCRLAFALDQQGDSASAAIEYRAALGRDPRWPDKFRVMAARLIEPADVQFGDAR